MRIQILELPSLDDAPFALVFDRVTEDEVEQISLVRDHIKASFGARALLIFSGEVEI